MKKSAFSPGKANSPRGVGFFQQFTRQFLRPYGEVDEAPIPETVFKRVKPFTCEWLLRPKVALSELSETVVKNLEILAKKHQNFLAPETVDKLVSEFRPLRKSLKVLHKDSVTAATEEDVIETLKLLFQENDDLDAILEQMFHVGGALFVTATQVIVAKTLIQDPESYAELVEAEDTGSDSVFKQNGDIESMRNFIVSSVLGKRRKKPAKGSRKDLLKQFDSPAKRGKQSRVPQETSSSPQSSETEEAVAEAVPDMMSKPAKKRKKNVGLQLLAADEAAMTTTKNKKKK